MRHEISKTYQWQIETTDGYILNQYNDDGSENNWKLLSIEKIIRVSVIPAIVGFIRHDCFIDIGAGEKFVKRFGRGIMKNTANGYVLSEYIHCIETMAYRMWICSTTGQVMVTRPDYELYI